MLEGEWPLIGRDDELARFGQLLAHPGTCGVVLGGDSGVGKTRLATECLRLCDAEGLRTVRISGTRSGSGLPLGAVAFLLPETPETLEYGPGELARYLREAAEAVVRGTDGRRLVLLVDDAHLLDDASAVLVNRLSVTGGAFVLATVTTGVEVPAVPDAVRSLWKDWAAVHLTLRGLSAARVADVLTTVLGGPVDPAAAGHLAEHAEGNMLFLRELILGAVEAGSLRDDGGIWRIVGPLSPSDRLKELVNDRLSRLNAHERLLLDVLAVGEPLGVAELESFGDRATVEMLEAKGLLQTRRNGHRLEVWLAHPVHGDVLRSQLGPLRASSLARELADALESTGARRRTDVMRIAMWRLEGGGTDPTVMIAGARTALFRHDLGLAERLALAALDAGGGFEAELLVAQLAALQGRGEEAEDRFAALTEAGADDQQRGPVAIARLDNLATYLGRLNDALRVAEEAETRIADQDWRDEIAARRAGILICLDGPSRALDAAEPVYRRGRGRAHIFACAITSHACGRLGRLQEALDAADHGARTELGVTGLFERASWIHAWWRGDALAYLGRVVEAEQLAQREYEQGLADRSPEAQAWFAWQLARRALERGHLEPAVRRALEALALFRELGRRSFEQAAGIHLALALGLQGKIVGAQQALTRLESLGPVVWMPVELLEERAWVAAVAGENDQALQTLRRATALGRRTGDLVGESCALHAMARLGRPREVRERLARLSREIEGDLVDLRVRHVSALARADPAELDAVSHEFERWGLDLLAAEASAEAVPAWRARAEPRLASHAEHRAAQLAERCEGAATPALLPLRMRAQLTPAELRVVLRASSGQSNKDIAAELRLSPRTVGNHLQHAYEKLGVRGRAELPQLVGPGGDLAPLIE